MSRKATEDNGKAKEQNREAIFANTDRNPNSLANLKLFKPGQSGNPNGRPRKTTEEKSAKKLALDHAAAAVKTLAKIMNDEEAPPSSRVTAALGILDRGLGKPVQPVENGKPGDFSEIDDEALDAFIIEKATEFTQVYRSH